MPASYLTPHLQRLDLDTKDAVVKAAQADEHSELYYNLNVSNTMLRRILKRAARNKTHSVLVNCKITCKDDLDCVDYVIFIQCVFEKKLKYGMFLDCMFYECYFIKNFDTVEFSNCYFSHCKFNDFFMCIDVTFRCTVINHTAFHECKLMHVVFDRAEFKGVPMLMSISGLGSIGRMLTVCPELDLIWAGCFHGDSKTFLKAAKSDDLGAYPAVVRLMHTVRRLIKDQAKKRAARKYDIAQHGA